MQEVTVRLEDIVSVYAGEEIRLVAIIDNNSTKVRNVTVGLSATTTTYDGVGVKDIATMNFKKEPIQPGQSKTTNDLVLGQKPLLIPPLKRFDIGLCRGYVFYFRNGLRLLNTMF